MVQKTSSGPRPENSLFEGQAKREWARNNPKPYIHRRNTSRAKAGEQDTRVYDKLARNTGKRGYICTGGRGRQLDTGVAHQG